MKPLPALALVMAVAILSSVGCGASAGNGTGGGSGAATGGGSGAGGGSACTNLTVKNFDSWCSVSVAGGAASSAAAQTVCLTPGSIALVASPLTGFILGPDPWHHTSGDTGSGDPGTRPGDGTSHASLTLGASAACVGVCCPFTNGTGCPSADQCP